MSPDPIRSSPYGLALADTKTIGKRKETSCLSKSGECQDSNRGIASIVGKDWP